MAEYQAEAAALGGSAQVVDLSLADGGQAVSGVGGARGNANTLTFTVPAAQAGPHAVVFRSSNLNTRAREIEAGTVTVTVDGVRTTHPCEARGC